MSGRGTEALRCSPLESDIASPTRRGQLPRDSELALRMTMVAKSTVIEPGPQPQSRTRIPGRKWGTKKSASWAADRLSKM
jgi:hypothetical protein